MEKSKEPSVDWITAITSLCWLMLILWGFKSGKFSVTLPKVPSDIASGLVDQQIKYLIHLSLLAGLYLCFSIATGISSFIHIDFFSDHVHGKTRYLIMALAHVALLLYIILCVLTNDKMSMSFLFLLLILLLIIIEFIMFFWAMVEEQQYKLLRLRKPFKL